jgi:hypothetical protein
MVNHKAFLLISLPLILLFFLPALFFDYAFSDDYYGLWQQRVSENWTEAAFIHGRPLQGTIISTIFSWAATVSGLWKIRAISILILILISYMLYREFFIFFKGNSLLAAIFCLLPVFVPSFGIITVWAATFPIIISLALSLLAGQILLYKTSNIIKQVCSIIFAFTLLIISLVTYQTPVVACLIPWLIRSPRLVEQSKAIKQLLTPLIVFIVSNIIYIIAFKIYQSQSGLEIGRTGLTNNILDKIQWFYEEPFLLAGSTFATLAPKGFRIVVLLITMLSFSLSVFLFVKRIGFKKKWWFFVICIIAIPLSYYVNILTVEKFSSYRTQAVLTCVFIFGLAMANYELIKEKFRWVGGVILLLLFLLVGTKHLYTDFILLQNHDWKAMIQVVKQNHNKKSINILRTNPNVAVQKKIVTSIGMDEFGIPGSSVKWATEPMIKLILVDVLNKNDTSLSVNIYNYEDTSSYSNIESLIRLNSNFDNY